MDLQDLNDLDKPEFQQEHHAIPMEKGLFAIAWDKRCDTCKNGLKHYAKMYTFEELRNIVLKQGKDIFDK